MDKQNIQRAEKTKLPKVNVSIKKWATELNTTFYKEEIQMAKTHMKNAHQLWPKRRCKSKPG
jgi:hypothetical protein